MAPVRASRMPAPSRRRFTNRRSSMLFSATAISDLLPGRRADMALAKIPAVPMSELHVNQDYWDRQAQRDPLWAILSDATKRDGKWDAARFFQTGSSEIASILYELEAQGFEVRRGAALDFGCGVGRLTQAMATQFERVV